MKKLTLNFRSNKRKKTLAYNKIKKNAKVRIINVVNLMLEVEQADESSSG